MVRRLTETKLKQTGIFYVVCLGEEDLTKGKFKLIHRFGNDLEHSMLWKELIQKDKRWQDYPYWFFPHGRVIKTDNKDPSKRKHEIIISDEIAYPAVIGKIKDVFGLDVDTKVRNDNSGEYDSILLEELTAL